MRVDVITLFAVFLGYVLYQSIAHYAEQREVCTAELAQYNVPQAAVFRACGVTVQQSSNR